MTTKTLPLFTASLNTRAWAIRRSLASLNRCGVMQISWKECLYRASMAMRMAVARRQQAEKDAAEAARLHAFYAGHRQMVADGIAAGAGMGYFVARACAAA